LAAMKAWAQSAQARNAAAVGVGGYRPDAEPAAANCAEPEQRWVAALLAPEERTVRVELRGHKVRQGPRAHAEPPEQGGPVRCRPGCCRPELLW